MSGRTDTEQNMPTRDKHIEIVASGLDGGNYEMAKKEATRIILEAEARGAAEERAKAEEENRSQIERFRKLCLQVCEEYENKIKEDPQENYVGNESALGRMNAAIQIYNIIEDLSLPITRDGEV